MGTCFECRVTSTASRTGAPASTPVREGMAVALGAPRRFGSREALRATSCRSWPTWSWSARAGRARGRRARRRGGRAHRCCSTTNPRPGGQIWRYREEPPRAALAWMAGASRAREPRRSPAPRSSTPRPRELLVEHEGRAPPRALRPPRARDRRPRALPALPRLDAAGRRRRRRRPGAAQGRRRLRRPPRRGGGLGPAPARGGRRARRRRRAHRGRRRAGAARTARSRSARACGARRASSPRASGYAARLAGAPYRTGAWVREVAGARRRAPRDDSRTAGASWAWDCDVLALRLRPRAEPRAAAPPRLRRRRWAGS